MPLRLESWSLFQVLHATLRLWLIETSSTSITPYLTHGYPVTPAFTNTNTWSILAFYQTFKF